MESVWLLLSSFFLSRESANVTSSQQKDSPFLVMSSAGAVTAPLVGDSFARYGYPAVLGVTAGVTLAAACVFRLLVGKDLAPVSQPSPADAVRDVGP